MTDRIISIYDSLEEVPSDFTGTARIENANYIALVDATATRRIIHGSSDDIAYRPTAAALGKGSWQVGDVIYTCNGISYAAQDGSITAPDGFNWPVGLPEVIAYKNGDKFTCNLKPEDIIDTTQFATTVYVNRAAADDTGNGLTWATAKQKISSGRIVANGLGVPCRILVKAGIYEKSYGYWAATNGGTQPMLFEAIGGRVVTGSFEALTWSLVAAKTHVYEAVRTTVANCFNPSIVDNDGFYKEYTWVASIDLCDTTEGSWFEDGAKVYCHPHGGVAATNLNCRAYLTIQGGFSTSYNGQYMIRGFDVEGGLTPFKIYSATAAIVVADRCTFRYGSISNIANGGTTYENGVTIIGGCALAAFFNSDFSKNTKDGINMHLSGAVRPSLLTVNCTGFDNGRGGSTSNNGWTTHDGLSGIDIGGIYEASYGANVGSTDINTHVWHVGTVAGNSLGDIERGGTINYGGFAMIIGAGAKMWLDSCEDWGCDIGVYAGTGATVYLRNHKGSGSRVGNILSY